MERDDLLGDDVAVEGAVNCDRLDLEVGDHLAVRLDDEVGVEDDGALHAALNANIFFTRDASIDDDAGPDRAQLSHERDPSI